jgi:hypothetical protein
MPPVFEPGPERVMRQMHTAPQVVGALISAPVTRVFLTRLMPAMRHHGGWQDCEHNEGVEVDALDTEAF